MDALNQGEQARIASQLVAERVECTQVAFGFSHIIWVLLKLGHHHWVVDMQHGDVLLLELLAKQHILVTTHGKALVEGTLEESFATNHKVS